MLLSREECREILGDRYTDEQLDAIRVRYTALARVLIDWYVEERGRKRDDPR